MNHYMEFYSNINSKVFIEDHNMYTVKYTYQKLDSDVLLEHMLGPVDSGTEIFHLDSRVLDMRYYRSDDRTYAEIHIVWESKAKYDEWDADHTEAHRQCQYEFENYHKDMSINFAKIEPPSDDWDWAEHSEDRIQEVYPVTWVQIFEF